MMIVPGRGGHEGALPAAVGPAALQRPAGHGLALPVWPWGRPHPARYAQVIVQN